MNNRYIFLLSLIILLFSCSQSYSQLNGSYVIGTGGNYETITSAVNALVTEGVNGQVVFNIKTGSYFERVTIDSIPGSSEVNNIIFRSKTGIKEDVIWHYSENFTSTAVVTLVKADHITFQNITFQNDYSNAVQYVFILSLNCDEINILNNIITTVGGLTSSYGIYSNAASTKNLTITGNTIASIYSIDLRQSDNSSGTKIIGNHISGQTGVYISNHDSLRIEENIIDPFPFTVLDRTALSINNCGKFIRIVKNKIISNGSPRTMPGNGISISNCVFDSSLIANNFVRYTGGRGLFIINSQGLNIYFNTIRSPGNYPPDYATNLTLENTSQCNVKNNILGGTNSDYRNDFNSSLSSDYNCFYPDDSTESPHILFYNGTGYSNIEQFRTVSNNDFNSLINIVNFVSNTDFHLAVTSIGDERLVGTPVQGITDDIDGDPRDPFFPYMGADESDMALPVELNSFSSNVSGRDVSLIWITTSENNNYGFAVEKAIIKNASQVNWTDIGFVKGNGTVNSPENYSFPDKNLNSGKYKYRLKQIDYNGNYQYFPLNEEIVINPPEKFFLSQNYPNPFNPNTTINYQVPVNGFISIKIYDVTGQEIIRPVNEYQTAGYYEFKFNGSGLPSGVYFYKIESGDFTATKKMLLMK